MRAWIAVALLVGGGSNAMEAQAWVERPREVPAIKAFLGTAGFGTRNPAAPPETEQWGRLVGLWVVDQEIRRRDSTWMDAGKGIWVWRYILDGFAVSDLWFQGQDALPPYLGDYGRDYLLSGVRVFEATGKRWKVAFVGNGAGQGPGADFSTFEAHLTGDRLVMTMEGPPVAQVGIQRVVFADFTPDSFSWVSEYSQDEGKTWLAFMRLKARRIE